ncbi:hypothetical protein ColLi_13995 [Colletotrichum liriopes]|uniref:Uncharacterized protein n=1 Tax=Colletotrichum liriopes TaxID=708192 RepID=A0AA37H3D0_9PEZI|nr:hypothetical protein ColLi_13995 [Colletotrichum liriopes]
MEMAKMGLQLTMMDGLGLLPGSLATILHLVFGPDFTAAKAEAEGPARLRNAARALYLANPILLFLYTSPAVCCSASPVDTNAIFCAVRERMLARHMLLPGSEAKAPIPSVNDVSKAADASADEEEEDVDEDEVGSCSYSYSCRCCAPKRPRQSLSQDELPDAGRSAFNDAVFPDGDDEAPSFLTSVLASLGNESAADPAADSEPSAEDGGLLERQLTACAFLVQSGVPAAVTNNAAGAAARSFLTVAENDGVIAATGARKTERRRRAADRDDDSGDDGDDSSSPGLSYIKTNNIKS